MRVLITGATGGIGSECVKELINRNHEVIAISRSLVKLQALKETIEKEYNKDIIVIASDFSEADFELKIRDNLVKNYPCIDGLINNAGMLINKPFSELTKQDVASQMRINFEAPLLLIQSLIPMLLKSKQMAHVVNIGSMGGFQGSQKFPGLSAYSASKGALSVLTECLATEYNNENIRFNCLALGSADTEMLRKAFDGYKSPMKAKDIATYIVDFTLNGQKYFNGKVLPVASLST